MTYCAAAIVNEGLILVSDSRTNAGVDNVSTFRKSCWFPSASSLGNIAVASSGNLSITQEVFASLSHLPVPLGDMPTARDAARTVGEVLRNIRTREAPFLGPAGVDYGANLLVVGQCQNDDAPRAFLVYSEGNFIEASPYAPYLQIGETKYGKPILDRAIRPEMSLNNAMTAVLISFDSTMRSNLSVGAPLDVTVLRTGAPSFSTALINDDDPFFRELREKWSLGLRNILSSLPDPWWSF